MERLTRQALLATVCYADIFAYPLTIAELLHWVIRPSQQIRVHPRRPLPLLVREVDRERMRHVPRAIEMKDSYIFLRGRGSIVRSHRLRMRWAPEKWRIAQRAGNVLRLVPTLRLVGVTGGLSMDNARYEHDIDLFFITARGTLWITRFLVAALLELIGTRRRPGEKEVRNAICLNMFMSEDSTRMPRNEQDLYAAHEVLQMRPLWDRYGAYHEFLRANRWVERYLPNAWMKKNQELRTKNLEQKRKTENFFSPPFSFLVLSPLFIARLLEKPSKHLQLWYMKRHRTTEVVTGGMLRFHPRDARLWVKKALDIRLQRYNIPLDKIFYAR